MEWRLITDTTTGYLQNNYENPDATQFQGKARILAHQCECQNPEKKKEAPWRQFMLISPSCHDARQQKCNCYCRASRTALLSWRLVIFASIMNGGCQRYESVKAMVDTISVMRGRDIRTKEFSWWRVQSRCHYRDRTCLKHLQFRNALKVDSVVCRAGYNDLESRREDHTCLRFSWYWLVPHCKYIVSFVYRKTISMARGSDPRSDCEA